ncbi:MAG: hydantoinase/oxoprolinase family protein [Proteobacteria bacterium]|nr:hydantoinase/oxoprolinase family protein [Pseudomonadota bacterium]
MQIIGVDTGGTFTDLVFQDGPTWRTYKLLSTPRNPAQAVLAGLKFIACGPPRQIIHGSTVATNAILERKGAKTALVTNTGFTDILIIGRQNRSRLYDLFYRREPSIVPPELCFGVPGRILKDGQEHQKFDDASARAVCQEIAAAGVESVAVSFIFSFTNFDHECKMAEMIEDLGIPVSLSHQILSEFREFERTSTTVINAYIGPKMERYLSYLQDNLSAADSLRIMQSNGGGISAETAMKEPVRTILSGPAGGVVGAYEIARNAKHPRLITFDMGGTSTDVSLIDGSLSMTLESEISGYPVRTPMIDIHTVGAGGGSVAAIDSGGSLTVGPESAGADPGPICYGKGNRITVTDANLYLGRLIPEHFLGGNMRLYTERLHEHFERMARRIGLDPMELAEGILAVANANMERAIRVISVERGHDPREFILFAFGGAGGLHAAEMAGHLNIPRVLIPKNPGILSAMGMLMADIVKDYSQTVMLHAGDIGTTVLEEYFHVLQIRGTGDLTQEGINSAHMVMERFLDMRYAGQSYEIITPFALDFIETFHALHQKTYGYRNDKPVEIVNVRLRARGIPQKPVFEKMDDAGRKPPDAAFLDERKVVFDGKRINTSVFKREALGCGNRITGPAVIVEYSSTAILPPQTAALVDEFGNIIIEINTIVA